MAGTVSSVASTSSAELNSQSEITLKAKSDDVGWEYAIRVDPKNSNKLKCLLCNTVTCGIFRIKQHIANIKGNVEGCKPSSELEEMRELEEEFISDEEEEEALNFDFESENEEVLEGYGEEEFED
ncbi:unnamed protein product [Rhodiola kirilowii]